MMLTGDVKDSGKNLMSVLCECQQDYAITTGPNFFFVKPDGRVAWAEGKKLFDVGSDPF